METRVLELSKKFWKAMETADEAGMRAIAHPDCMFVHIGATVGLEEEIKAYVEHIFEPTKIEIHKQEVKSFGSTEIVLSDVDYTLLLNGQETTHHFMVTEVFVEEKLVQFSFTALVY